MLIEPLVRFQSLSSGNSVAVCWEIAAHSPCDMFSKYSYLVVNLLFSRLGVCSVNFFLNAPFPGHCLLVPHFSRLGPELLVCCLAHRGSTGRVFFFCSGIQ